MSYKNSIDPTNNEENAFFRKSIMLLLGSLTMGILFNMLFFDKTPGISIPLFVIAFYIFFLAVMRGRMSVKPDITGLLMIVILLLSSTFALFSNPLLLFFNLLALPVLLAAHTILISGKNTSAWHSIGFIGDLICEGVVGLLAYCFKPFSLLLSFTDRYKNPQRMRNIAKIAAGIAISVPVAFIVITLLSSADAVFQNMLRSISNLFADTNLSSFAVQLSIIIIVTLLVFSYVWNLAIATKNKTEAQELKNRSELKLDFIIVSTVLSVLCIIYLFFITIQFTYLFGSVNMHLPAHLTYAEYARKGFFELVVITMINLSVLLAAISFTKKPTDTSEKVLRLLETFLVISATIILFSAHFRMSLYEKIYGYTYLRFFTHAFMLYLFALLLAVAAGLWMHKLVLSKLLVCISLLAFTMINFVNADKFIAAKNTAAYQKTGKIDVVYLSELSYSGVPYMLDVLKEMKVKNPDARETKILENNLFLDKKRLSQSTHWQSFNLSATKAKELLQTYPLTWHEISDRYDDMD